MKKKILLLTASYGTGHVSACKSVQKALLELYPDKVDTEIIDFLKTEGFSSSTTIIQKIYNKSMEIPAIWDKFFYLSDNKFTHFLFDTVFPKFHTQMYDIFDTKNPDIAVVSHPYWSFIINSYNKEKNKKLKNICIVTDSTMIHCTWFHPVIDYYIVADGESRDVMINRFGVNPEKVFALGFPVSPELGREFSQRQKFISDQGLNPNLPTILFVVGLGDTEKFITLIDFLNSVAQKLAGQFQIIIVTGKYKNIYDMLNQRKYNILTKIIGWTDKMHDFIRASDLVIAKGGGAIVMETLAAARPVLVPVFTPGQERGNVQFIRKYGLGFGETDLDKIKTILTDLISNPNKLKEMQNKIKQVNKPSAAVNVAKFVMEHI